VRQFSLWELQTRAQGQAAAGRDPQARARLWLKMGVRLLCPSEGCFQGPPHSEARARKLRTQVLLCLG